MESMPEKIVREEVIKMLRRQRHDFINHIQVLHAYLQLGKVEKALAYLEDLAEDTNQNDLFAKYSCQEDDARNL